MSIKIKKCFVLRKIGPQYMAVPFGAMTQQIKGMITLTESGYLLWQALDSGVDSKEALVARLLEEYDVRKCFYGHLHGGSHGLAIEGLWNGVEFKLVSADKLGFSPYTVIA